MIIPPPVDDLITSASLRPGRDTAGRPGPRHESDRTDDHLSEDPMPISRADVEHVARLARLDLSDEEIDRYQAQLAGILTEAEKVRQLPTEGVPPTAHAVPMANVWRADEVGACLTQAEALSTAPEAEQGRFRVPRILEDEA